METKTYYSEEYRKDMLELSDKHLDWDICSALDKETDEFFDIHVQCLCDHFCELFEEHYHTAVYRLGRSGRHVCVEDTAANRRRYEHMVKAVDAMQKMIVFHATENKSWYTIYSTNVPTWLMKWHNEIKNNKYYGAKNS